MNEPSFSQAAVEGVFYKPSSLGRKGKISNNGVPFACAFLSTPIGMTGMPLCPQNGSKRRMCCPRRKIFID